MEDLNFKPISEYNPHAIMIFYKNDNNEDYVEAGKIIKNKMTSRVPATLESISFLKNISSDEYEDKIRPIKMNSSIENFIHYDNDIDDVKITWKTKETKRIINVQGKQFIYYCPRTVWSYKGNGEVYVFVLGKRNKLYHLPVPNIYEDGKICWGNVKVPNFKTSKELTENIEKLFWESNFSNHLNTIFISNKGYKKFFDNSNGLDLSNYHLSNRSIDEFK